MQEIGTVKELIGKSATVVFERNSACSSCKACQVGAGGRMYIEAENKIGAKPGDRVRLEIENMVILKAALVVYFVPGVAFVTGVLLGNSLGDSETAGLGLGVLLLVISLAGASIYSKRKKDQFGVKLMEVVK